MSLQIRKRRGFYRFVTAGLRGGVDNRTDRVVYAKQVGLYEHRERRWLRQIYLPGYHVWKVVL